MITTDYAFYTDEYKGQVIPTETDFNTAQTEASAYVNAVTRGKANNLASIPDVYYDAICAVAEIVYNDGIRTQGNVKSSESVGNHSIAYVNTTVSSAESDAIKARKVRMYLTGTGLLYSGLSGGGL